MKISIVTPSYNQGKFIRHTLDSILNQNVNFPIEYILVDAVSTDETPKIVEEFVPKFKAKGIEFIYICEKDNGQSDAINKGLKMATGDIVAYLNSDDTYEPETFNKVWDFFEKNPDKKWVYGKCKIIDDKDREIRKPITFYKNLLLKNYSYSKLLSENVISQPATFWKWKLHNEIGYFNEKEHFCMDYEFWLRIGQKYPAGVIDDYLANFRYYMNSKSGSVNKKQFRDELRLAKKYSKNKTWPIILHKFNYYKITLIYRLLNIIK